MDRPKSARRDDSLGHLERKLAVYANGYPKSSRSAALEILTGHGPAVDSTEPYSGATYQATRRLLTSEEALPSYGPIAFRPPVTATPQERHGERLHIERTKPPRPVGRVLRSIVLAVAVIAAVAAAGLEVMLLTGMDIALQPLTAPDGDDAYRGSVGNQALPTTVTADADLSAGPSANIADSSSPQMTASPSIPVPATRMGVLLDEHFTSNTYRWPDNPTETAWLAGGTYWLAPRQASHFVAISIPGAQDLGDTVVSARFHKVGGPEGGGYGLILRGQAPDPLDGRNQFGHYYVFEAGDRGQFGVWLRNGDHWVDLLTWTPSDAINRGTAENEMTVTAIGDQFSFLINGTPVATETDALLHTGAAGVFVGGDDNQVALDRLTVRVPR
jgi:hypothetical protein